MPSDESSKSSSSSDKGKEVKENPLTKMVATVFATVVAPVLIALGMKFNDVILAPFQPKPAEATKAEPEKSGTPAAGTAKEVVPSQPATTPAAGAAKDIAQSQTGATPAADGKETAPAETAPRKTGKKNRRGGTKGEPESAPASSSAYTSLFNGRDLSGWETAGSDIKRWSADLKSGALSGTAAAKKQGNWLYSSKDFTDFRLRCEFRLGPDAESGIALRTPAVFNVREGRMAIHLTNNDKDSNPTGTFVIVSGGAAQPQSKPKPAASLRSAQEWNLIEIEFRGRHLSVSINGQTLQDIKVDQSADAVKTTPGLLQKTGRVALECRTGHVEFRKIEIQELK